MTQRSVEDKFERTWLAKFAYSIEENAGKDLKDKIMDGNQDLTFSGNRIKWTENAISLLDFHTSEGQKKDIMNNCACFYHFPELLNQYKEWYEELKDISKLHNKMKTSFEQRLLKRLGDMKVEDDFVKKVFNENWGEIGRIDGNKITVIKMPAKLQQYLKASSKEERDDAYCHCPRLKGLFKKKEKPISSTYCYCGGGFYTSLWEHILEKPVDIELKKSLLDGDDICSFELTV